MPLQFHRLVIYEKGLPLDPPVTIANLPNSGSMLTDPLFWVCAWVRSYGPAASTRGPKGDDAILEDFVRKIGKQDENRLAVV